MKFIFNGEALNAIIKSIFFVLPPKFLPLAKVWAGEKTLLACGKQIKSDFYFFFRVWIFSTAIQRVFSN